MATEFRKGSDLMAQGRGWPGRGRGGPRHTVGICSAPGFPPGRCWDSKTGSVDWLTWQEILRFPFLPSPSLGHSHFKVLGVVQEDREPLTLPSTPDRLRLGPKVRRGVTF